MLAALLLATSAFAQPLVSREASFAPGTIRVLILTGQSHHDWRTTTPFLRQILNDAGGFDVRVTESPVGITAESIAPFDVLVDDYSGPSLGSAAEKAIEAFVKSGKGLVVVHGALDSFRAKPAGKGAGWPGFTQMTKAQWSPTVTNDLQAPFRLLEGKIASPEHPVTQGMKSSFRTADAPYHGVTLLPGAQPLVTTREENGKEEPLIFASSFGRGRVFCTLLGNDVASMQEPAFITTFVRGAAWAGLGKVNLPTELTMPQPNTNAVRVLIVAGGHDHYASFYSLFDGYKDLSRAQVISSDMAFKPPTQWKPDLRTMCDVLVLYDFTRDLDDVGKQNLKNFVEAGKGIVVLHHAILDQQHWPWWSEEVVGGRYRLSSENGIPSSRATMGQELFVIPAETHPITAGIGPFHLIDEPYKGMWISPKIRPLLTVNQTNSDPNVAWIGPCQTSKVVFIQLGHDHSPARHPSYRALVHNAILWSAGRLP